MAARGLPSGPEPGVTSVSQLPRIGLAVATIGRPAIKEMLASAARCSQPPAAVVVANQSAQDLGLDARDYPFDLEVLPSSGGVSAGRNAAAAALGEDVDLLGFPNDDCLYPPGTLQEVAETFVQDPHTVAVACRLEDPAGPRMRLPPPGTVLDRRTVWRALEPATFVRRAAFAAASGFRHDLGTGGPTAWGSGEGTDLLLRLMAAGGRVVSRQDVAVLATAERRDLDDRRLVAKHRSYARGTGFVYREHGYPLRSRLRTLVGPLVRATAHDPRLQVSLRLAVARSVGRLEGLTGRVVDRGPGAGRGDGERGTGG